MNIRLINDAFYKLDFMEFLMRLPCSTKQSRLPFANGIAALREQQIKTTNRNQKTNVKHR